MQIARVRIRDVDFFPIVCFVHVSALLHMADDKNEFENMSAMFRDTAYRCDRRKEEEA
jgi:hypothetical protein